MAKTSYIDIDPATQELFNRGLRSGDRLIFSSVRKKTTILSRRRKKGLSQRSLLPQTSALWAELTTEQKAAWSAAGAVCGLNGWRLFVQDTCLRIINDMPGVATPSLIHQSLVGDVQILAPATEAKLVQLHPKTYWVSQKVPGKKRMYVPALVTEAVRLPLKIGLSYRSELEVAGPNPEAKLYAEVWSSYQGADILTEIAVENLINEEWTTVEDTLTSVIGYVISYNLCLYFKDLQGDFYFDNVKAEHDGQNWARDPFCTDINQGFTRAFYQIPKHWVGDIIPEGVTFESVYKDS